MAVLTATQKGYAQRIIAAIRARGLSQTHAIIAIEVALAESALWMYANVNNPRSLLLPHDRVGSDHGSVGLFQQQVGGAANSTANWGTTAELMNVEISAGKFLDALARVGIQGRTRWGAAQAVQRSAVSDGSNYRAHDERAQRIVTDLWAAPPPDVPDAPRKQVDMWIMRRKSDGTVWLVGGDNRKAKIGSSATALHQRAGVPVEDVDDKAVAAIPDRVTS